MHHHTENESSLFSLLLSCLLCLLSLSLSFFVSACLCLRVLLRSCCCGVLWCVMLCCVLCCGVCARCVVWCGALKNPVRPLNTSPCVRPKRPHVSRHHAHMLKHVCAWCRFTRGRFGRTHGVEEGGGSSSASRFSSRKQVMFENFRSILTRCCVHLLSPIFCFP